MRRRFIVSGLVFTLLGYGSAWAFAGHALDILSDESAGMHADPLTALDGDDCDHCCHAAAHMVGLAPPLPAFLLPNGNSYPVVFDSSAPSLATGPPPKPPRS